ncbi:MAG: hypothetical protein HY901_08960 [Deltaproteobacteria bacterium]|nr:hypothetical protein [Deltaproteobacteria bacterium]
MRLALAIALALLTCGCGIKRVDEAAVARLPLESKLDLIEAENDLFIAVDSVDEAANRVLETREDYRNADQRISEAKEALATAESANDPKLVEIGKLSVQESKERKEFLSAWEDVMWAMLDVEKAKLDLAKARYERSRAQAVKKANVEGAQKIKVDDFDKQVAELEAAVKKETAAAQSQNANAEKVRGTWYATRRVLAAKTGGAQGSPWVE